MKLFALLGLLMGFNLNIQPAEGRPCKCWTDYAVTAGAILGAPFAVAAGVNAAGFTSAGIAANSIGASMMSLCGGATQTGGVVATLQSVGAAGLGKAGITVAGGGAAYVTNSVLGEGNCECKD